MTFDKMFEKQSTVLTKMYKSCNEMERKHRVFKCTERGIIYYIFMHQLMIPYKYEDDYIIRYAKIKDVDIPQFSVPRFLEQFYYFGGGYEEYRVEGIPDKKDLKEAIKAAGGLRNVPLYKVDWYNLDASGSLFPIKDERYIQAKDLLYIYDFLAESKYENIDLYVVPSRRTSPFYFKGQYGSGYIMPTIARLNEKIDESRIINK